MDICGWTIQQNDIKTQFYAGDYSSVLESSLMISFIPYPVCEFKKKMLTSAVFLILLSVQGVQGQVEGLG